MILHYLLIPVKVLTILAIVLYRRVSNPFTQPFSSTKPNEALVRMELALLKMELKGLFMDGPDGAVIYKTNPDHQILRHAAASWADPQFIIVEGMSNYMIGDKVIRGPKSPYDASAGMYMSAAFSITSGLLTNKSVSQYLRGRYLEVVNGLMAKNMRVDKDVSTELRKESNGFDTIYALAMLFTAYTVSKDKKYLIESAKILFLKGYIAYLIAPITHKKESDRRFFIDHIAIFGLWTAIVNCPKPFFWLKPLLKYALTFILAQSYKHTNPYLSALADEVGALPALERRRVLSAHANASVRLAARNTSESRPAAEPYPVDYSQISNSEFSFDDAHSAFVKMGNFSDISTPLNGVVLGKSLLVLLERNK